MCLTTNTKTFQKKGPLKMRSRMIWRGANKYDFSFRNLSFGKKSIALKNVCILSVVINYYNEVLFLGREK